MSMRSVETIVAPPLTEHFLLPFLIGHYLDGGHAISLWQMPNSDEKNLLISSEIKLTDTVTLENAESGFVFTPFDNTKSKVFLKGDLIYTFKSGAFVSDNLPEDISSKISRHDIDDQKEIKYPSLAAAAVRTHTDYKQLVQACIDNIRNGAFEKVVPSRSREVSLPESFDPIKTFNTLCTAYPNCMISLVCSEETGTWIGATPELLASVDDKMHFRTVSLAGTKRYTPDMNLKSIAWTEKEIEEQAMVSRYIISCFKKIRLREYNEQGPRTAVAGNLVHLKTEYEVDMVATNFPQLGTVMLQLLHPTSAVCGMPLEPALAFLRANEGYDRQFYSGFLGPVNVKHESRIFVNLRCMQLTNKNAILYAGAGVTIDSTPEQEWEETEMKFETLLSALR